MKRIKLPVSPAVLAMAVLGVSSAQAALPEFGGTFADKFTSSSGAFKFQNLESALELECTSSEGEGEVANAKTVTLTKELFLGCKAKISGINVGACTGLGETTSGDIKVSGTEELVGFELGGLLPVLALKINPIHIECPGNLIIVTGTLCAKVSLAKSLKETVTSATNGTAGDQAITDYEGPGHNGKMETCPGLQISINEGTAVMSSQNQTTTLTFAKEIEIKD